MSFMTLVIDSVLLLGIIAVSLYGAAVLPPAAQWPLHLGPGGYGNWVPRNVGLLMGPAIATIIYVMLAITARSVSNASAADLNAARQQPRQRDRPGNMRGLKGILTCAGTNRQPNCQPNCQPDRSPLETRPPGSPLATAERTHRGTK